MMIYSDRLNAKVQAYQTEHKALQILNQVVEDS